MLPPDPLVLPTGAVRQRPPIYSAVRVQGRRAYELARRGEAVEVPEREVTVYRFDQRWREGDRAAFVIDCSSGTYMRSLIADLGDAYCEELRRTRVGPFDVSDADATRVLPLERGAGVPAARRPRRRATRRAAPARPSRSSRRTTPTGEVLLVDADGPVAIAEPREGAVLKPIVGFRE